MALSRLKRPALTSVVGAKAEMSRSLLAHKGHFERDFGAVHHRVVLRTQVPRVAYKQLSRRPSESLQFARHEARGSRWLDAVSRPFKSGLGRLCVICSARPTRTQP